MSDWRDSLATLRHRFEAAANRHPGLKVILYHAGPGEYDKLETKPATHGDSALFLGADTLYGDIDPEGRAAGREIWFAENMPAIDEFRRLAEPAGECVSALPPEATEGVPVESLRARGWTRWTFLLFDLAWKQPNDSIFKARKSTWLPNDILVQYSKAALRGLVKCGLRRPILSSWANQLPDYFCSELPDAMTASADAATILLGKVEASRRESKRQKERGGSGKRGPKGPRYDAAADKRVFDGWKASGCKTHEDYARKEQAATTGKEIRDIHLAIERERKRRGRKGLK